MDAEGRQATTQFNKHKLLFLLAGFLCYLPQIKRDFGYLKDSMAEIKRAVPYVTSFLCLVSVIKGKG